VDIQIRQSKHRREIYLIVKSESKDFNLLKFYLALRQYVDKIEAEIGILEAAEGDH
jgi:hypothetical protein